jgi:hypothetical protein
MEILRAGLVKKPPPHLTPIRAAAASLRPHYADRCALVLTYQL